MRQARRAGNAALALGIPHGGWCPRGRLAEDGRFVRHIDRVEAVRPLVPPAQLIEKFGGAGAAGPELDDGTGSTDILSGADIDELKVGAVMVDEGPTYKRFRARARGMRTAAPVPLPAMEPATVLPARPRCASWSPTRITA